MSPGPVDLSAPRMSLLPAPGRRGCPLGTNCSCVFSRGTSSDAPAAAHDAAMDDGRMAAAVENWTDFGWKVVSADSHEVVLERQRGLPFCVNVLLCLATGLLWLAYWIPRARHPKTDRKTLTRSASGDVVAADSAPAVVAGTSVTAG